MDNEPILNEHNKAEFPPAHTAEHILNRTMVQLFGCSRSRVNHIERKKSKCNYDLPVCPTDEQMAEVERRVNEVIARDLPVTSRYVTRDEVPADIDLSKLPTDASETLRLVFVGDYDVCPCLGSHVAHTSQVGTFRITSTSWNEGSFRIVFRVTGTWDIAIRRASLADIPLIHSLADVAFRHTYRSILSPDQLDYMMDWMYSPTSLEQQMAVDGHVYFIASLAGDDVGYVSVQPQQSAIADSDSCGDGDIWHLQKIYVLPDHQHDGVGKALLMHALDYIQRTSGVPCRVELNVNRHNDAVHFYEHMGWTKLLQGDFPIGHGYFMNDYIMGFDIPAETVSDSDGL